MITVTVDGKETVLWAYLYKCCVLCGTTERRHVAKGLCLRCNGRVRAKKAYDAGRGKARFKKKG